MWRNSGTLITPTQVIDTLWSEYNDTLRITIHTETEQQMQHFRQQILDMLNKLAIQAAGYVVLAPYSRRLFAICLLIIGLS